MRIILHILNFCKKISPEPLQLHEFLAQKFICCKRKRRLILLRELRMHPRSGHVSETFSISRPREDKGLWAARAARLCYLKIGHHAQRGWRPEEALNKKRKLSAQRVRFKSHDSFSTWWTKDAEITQFFSYAPDEENILFTMVRNSYKIFYWVQDNHGSK